MTAPVALALAVALLWAAPVAAGASVSASRGAHGSAPAGGVQPRRQAQEEGDETAGAGTTTITTSGIFSAAGLTASSLLEVGAQCRSPLYQSDADSDGRIDRDEYAAFANALSGGYFTASACTTNSSGTKVKRCAFDDLPLALQSNFINLACLCERFQFGGDGEETDGCCVGDNAHISAAGAGPDEEPTEREALYLLTVCRETYTAVEEVRTEAPTDKPTKAPTESPTKAPTASPTKAPTASPTSKPTNKPTDKPTVSPTAVPTKRPTKKPTARITDDPTAGPTEAADAPTPVAAPTITTTPAPTAAAPSAPTSPLTSGPLPVSFGYAISNLQGYDAAAIVADPPTGGNTIAADLRGALGTILIPDVVAETFGGGNEDEGARRKQRRRRLGEQLQDEVPSPSQKEGGGETQQQMRMKTMAMKTTTTSSGRRRRRLLVQYDPGVDPAPTVDSVVDIGECD